MPSGVSTWGRIIIIIIWDSTWGENNYMPPGGKNDNYYYLEFYLGE
jgi:hypothetical protein